MRELASYKARLEAEKELAGRCYLNSGLVFCTEIGGHIEPRNFDRKFKKILRKAQISNISLHGLRHTYPTMLFELKVEYMLRQYLMGHSNTSMTAHYTHISKEMKLEASEKLEETYGHSIQPHL